MILTIPIYIINIYIFSYKLCQSLRHLALTDPTMQGNLELRE
jgi:hypothetical protein